MSVLLILVPSALMLGGAAAGTAGAAAGGSAIAGLAVLGGSLAGMVAGLAVKHSSATKTITYTTHFTDHALLEAAVQAAGFEVTERVGTLSAWDGKLLSLWAMGASGTYEASIDEAVDTGTVTVFFEAVYAQYGRLLQARVCDRVRSQAQEHGMLLESETVCPDGAVEMVLVVER